MSAYEVYLTLHIVGAVIWVGTAFAMVIFGTRAAFEHEIQRTAIFVRDSEWVGLRLFLPSNLVVLVSGILVVEKGHWGYDHLWVTLGLVGFGLSFVAGAAFFAPGWKRLGNAVSSGVEPETLRPSLRRMLVGSWIDLAILLGVLFVMTTKPAGGDTAKLLVAAAIVAAVGVVGPAMLAAGARERPSRASPIAH